MLQQLRTRDEWDDKNVLEKGFTLVELLVVIVILGILAGVVVFAVGGVTDRGQDSACRTDKRSIKTAAEAGYAKDGSYPADEAALVSGGFLESESDLYDYSAGGGSYTVTAVVGGDCVGI